MYGNKYFYTYHFHTYFPALVKLGIRELNIMPLSMWELHENWLREDHKFFMGVNEITFMCVL
jgi:hypothetical protein